MFYIAIGLILIGFIADTFQTDRFCSDRFQTDTFYSDTFCLGAGEKRVLMHLLTTRIKSLKNYFLTSGLVQNVFFAFAHTYRPPESSP